MSSIGYRQDLRSRARTCDNHKDRFYWQRIQTTWDLFHRAETILRVWGNSGGSWLLNKQHRITRSLDHFHLALQGPGIIPFLPLMIMLHMIDSSGFSNAYSKLCFLHPEWEAREPCGSSSFSVCQALSHCLPTFSDGNYGRNPNGPFSSDNASGSRTAFSPQGLASLPMSMSLRFPPHPPF